MATEEFEPKLNAIIAELLGVDENRLDPGATLVGDLGADELDHVELMMELELQFGVQVSDEEADRMITVDDVEQFIRRKKIGTKAAPPI